MPPVMGIAAFLMAEFLGQSYFEVVARGWVPASIYYVTSRYRFICWRLRYRMRLVTRNAARLDWRDGSTSALSCSWSPASSA